MRALHAREAAGGRPLATLRSAFMRYAGQGHEIAIALPDRALLASDVDDLRHRFEAEYVKQFARHIPGAAIEIMSWVVVATTAADRLARLAATAAAAAPAPIGTRVVFDTRLGQARDSAGLCARYLAGGRTHRRPLPDRRGRHVDLCVAVVRLGRRHRSCSRAQHALSWFMPGMICRRHRRDQSAPSGSRSRGAEWRRRSRQIFPAPTSRLCGDR